MHYNTCISTLSCKQVWRILKLIRWKLSSWSNTKFMLLIHREMCSSKWAELASDLGTLGVKINHVHTTWVQNFTLAQHIFIKWGIKHFHQFITKYWSQALAIKELFDPLTWGCDVQQMRPCLRIKSQLFSSVAYLTQLRRILSWGHWSFLFFSFLL